MRFFYASLWLIILLGITCSNSKIKPSHGHMQLVEFEMKYQGGYQAEGFDSTKLLAASIKHHDSGLTIIRKKMIEDCDFAVEDFNSFFRITPDTIFLFVDYNWVGGNRIGVMDLCVNEYIFTISNYPDNIPFKFVFD